MSDKNRGDRLSLEEQEELLRLMLREEGLSSFPEQITPVSREGGLQASFAQQRLWLLDQLKPGNSAYNIPLTLQLNGSLQVSILERSLYEIVRRHESLRTTFAMKNGQVFQVIEQAEAFTLHYKDLKTMPIEERKVAAQRILAEESQRAFDLQHGPLLRALLIRLSEQEHILLLITHHIISDGWSIDVLMRELSALYAAFAQGRPSPLAGLPIQYADFALWQRQWLQGEVLDRQVNYWKRQLGGVATLDLPIDHPRPSEQTFNGAYEFLFLPPALTRTLKALSKVEGVTLFMLMLTAFQVLLARYTGQDDIVVGTPIANRTRNEVSGLIGYFVNTLVLRSDLSGNPSFLDALHRVRKVCLDAYAHQDLPFEKVVEVLNPERDLSRTPLFQVMFIQQNMTPLIKVLDNLTFSVVLPENNSAKFDLTLSIAETDLGLQVMAEYNTDLFEASSMVRLLGHFRVLLEGIAAHPAQKLAYLPLLSGVELERLLLRRGTTTKDVALTCVHKLFEAQVAQNPQAIAVYFGQEWLSYQDLDQQANQLAHYLRILGVGSEVPVGIFVERSLAMIVALLATLKAGGAYVPLDPLYPRERLAFMVNDTRLAVLLTQEHLLAYLPEHQAKAVCLDTEWPTIAQQSKEAPDNVVQLDSLAYIIYTSGSTGKPKGVQIVHRALSNFLLSMQRQPAITAQDRLLAMTTLSFDISGLEIFLPLIAGAQIVLLSREVATDGFQLREQISASGATIMQATPATWRLLLEAGWAGNPRLKTLSGGEALSRPLARYLSERTASLWNMYGPTETTIWATIQRLRGTDEISLGSPIANTSIYLLDRYQQPVPVGVPGEIYLGGVGVARGYVRRPDLTAERFLPDPFSREPGSRLYRTGDLARYWPNGRLEYLGRLDNQVKVRGFRIELGEIEAALLQHPAMQEGVVLVHEDGPEDRRLVAYVAFQELQPVPQAQDLRAFLQRTLPDYMLPTAFVVLEGLPLTPNGKVDRRTLLALEAPHLAQGTIYAPPHTPLELALADIWSDILKVPQVGINDNFFALGGDSLLGVRMVAQAHAAGIHLMPRHFFQYQTIAQLATVAVVVQSSTSQAQNDWEVGEIPLTNGEAWQLFTAYNPHHFNFPILLEVQQALDRSLIERTIYHLIRYHDALRLRFSKNAAGWKQFLRHPDEPEIVPLTWMDLSTLPAPEQKIALEASTSHLQDSLNLFDGPVMRIAYYDLGAQKPGRLLWAINHVITDRVATQILIQDFQIIYQQLERGEEVHLPRKSTSLKRWAERLNEYVRSAEMRQEMEQYWLKLPWHKVAPLPVDHPEFTGSVLLAATDVVHVSLSKEETRKLQQLLNADTQMLDILLTILTQTYARWTGSPWQYICVSDHGRNTIFDDIDLSHTVGCLAYGRRLLLEWRETELLEDALRLIKEQIRAVPHRGMGYDMLYYLSEERKKLNIVPPTEVLIHYTGRIDNVSTEASLFAFASESPGHWSDLLERRNPPSCVQLVVTIAEDQLHLTWDYSRDLYERSTIEQMAQGYVKRLRQLMHELSYSLPTGI